MLRIALFAAVLSGGTLLLQTTELLPRDEAWLVSGVIAAMLLFAIPEQKKPRQPKELILTLIAVLGCYGIYFKFRPWLASLIDRRLATAVSVLLLLVFIISVFVPYVMRGSKSQIPNAR